MSSHSLYGAHSVTLDDYEQMLSAMVLDAGGRWPIIIPGNFNARTLE